MHCTFEPLGISVGLRHYSYLQTCIVQHFTAVTITLALVLYEKPYASRYRLAVSVEPVDWLVRAGTLPAPLGGLGGAADAATGAPDANKSFLSRSATAVFASSCTLIRVLGCSFTISGASFHPNPPMSAAT